MRPLTTLLLLPLALPTRAAQLLYLPLNETSGTTARDYSGASRHAQYINAPRLQGHDGVRLNGVNDYISLPGGLMRDKYSISVSLEVLVRSEQSGNYFLFGLGNTDANGYGNGYIFATGDPELRAAITRYTYQDEAEIRTTRPLQREVWKTITFVIDSANARIALYEDGNYLGGRTNSDAIPAPGAIGTGNTTANYIGRSVFSRDNYLAGSVRNFRLWDHVLSSAEVASLPRGPQQGGGGGQGGGGQGGGQGGGDAAADRVTAALVALNVQGLDDVRGNINLPSSVNGVQVAWESERPDVIANNGRVSRPRDEDVVVKLTAYITVDGVRGERAFYAVVRRL